jgi:hypothetical protein
MEVLYECCCGLDVHAKTVVACLIKRVLPAKLLDIPNFILGTSSPTLAGLPALGYACPLLPCRACLLL